MTSLERLLQPVTIPDFVENNWRKTPLLIPREDSFSDLLTMEDINAYLGRPGLIYPHTRLVGNGIEIDKRLYALNAGDFNFIDKESFFNFFVEGHTIVIQAANFHFETLSKFCSTLEEEMQTSVNANIYITPPSSQGFHPHFDHHEVIVIQLAGLKHWNLYDIPVVAPTGRQQITEEQRKHYLNSDPIHKIEIKPGNVLYIPSGVVHDAYTSEDYSVHITIGIQLFRRLDVLHKLTARAEKLSYFREVYSDLRNGEKVNSDKLSASVSHILQEIFADMPPYKDFEKRYKPTKDIFKSLLDIECVSKEGNLSELNLKAKNNSQHLLTDKENSILKELVYGVMDDNNSPALSQIKPEDIKNTLRRLIVKGILVLENRYV